ncbi:MAG: outer membrane beta-barrel protein, partial [Bacteroidota bacterium]
MSLKTKLPVILLFSLLAQFTFGQKYTVHNKKVSYFGLTGGINFSIPKITDNYSVLSSPGSSIDGGFDKKYENLFSNRGAQFSARYSYYLTNSLSIVTGFGYQSYGFKYFTDYAWTDTIGNQVFSREMHHLQKISYLTVPIIAKWDITKGQLKPFVQGGLYLEFRHQAKKVIYYDNTIDGEETENQLSSSPMVSIKDYTRKFNMGLTGGVGVDYHTKYVTFGLESNFSYGFYKIMNDENRYSDLNGFALQYLDVLDQMRLINLNVQLSVSIPIY